MEILKRAKGFESGDGVSFLESAESVKEEAIRRGVKAGHCNRDGTPTGAGKGDAYRPVNKKKYDENYDKIFNKS